MGSDENKTKSRSFSIWKGVRNDSISFSVDGEKIPLLVNQPVRILGDFTRPTFPISTWLP